MSRNQYFILLICIMKATSLSYNRPQLCENAWWNQNGVTFAQSGSSCVALRGIFVDDDDNVYSVDHVGQNIFVWWQNNNRNQTTISISGVQIHTHTTLFVTKQREIYFETLNATGYIVKLFVNSTNITFVTEFLSPCRGLFIDLNNTLYCSLRFQDRVAILSLNGSANTQITRAGTGTSGSNSTGLDKPFGIFVDTNFDLYVADSANNRIQRFRRGEKNGTTVAGSMIPSNLSLETPTDVVLDASGHLYIADNNNSRIIRVTSSGYQCLVGCSGPGTGPSQFNTTYSLRFDSHGNLFVTDQYNCRIQKFFLVHNCKTHSIHRPDLCPNATWNNTAITAFSNTNINQSQSRGIFIDVNNTFYFADYEQNRILIWPGLNFTQNFTSITNLSLMVYTTLFVTTTNQIYFADGSSVLRIIRTSFNDTNITVVKAFNGACFGLFIDVHDTLYCSLCDQHRVDSIRLNDTSSTPMRRAGNGANGAAMNQLNRPWGIFVDIDLSLYVADCSNNRIQRFRLDEEDGVTMAGTGIPNGLLLQCPTDVVLDGRNHLYIADNKNHRIIRVIGGDYQCLAGGCLFGNGSAAYQLHKPYSLRLDSFGNLYVADEINRRIQKFALLSDCGQIPVTALPTECLMTTSLSTSTDDTETTSATHSMTIHGMTTQRTSATHLMTTHEMTTQTTSGYTITVNPCVVLEPCLNQGVCSVTLNDSRGYSCSCAHGFNGTQCQFDQRVCRSNICRNQGRCRVSSNGTFGCECVSGWEGRYCERRINMCWNRTCENGGVCRNLFVDYKCECLGESYSGRHCEVESGRTMILRMVALSIACVAIIVIVSTALYIVSMDVMKYVFGIDPMRNERPAKLVKSKRKKVVIVHYVYVNS